MTDPDACAVNLEAILSKERSDPYASKLHRVVDTNSIDKCSIVVFFGGDLDCLPKGMDRN